MTAEKGADKCKGLGVERAFSSRHQCLKTKGRSIFITNRKHLCSEAWRRGWGCSFSRLGVSLPPLVCQLLGEQAAGASRSVDRRRADRESRGLSTA